MQPSKTKLIAYAELILVDLDGIHRPVRAGTGAPFRNENGDWSTPVAIEAVNPSDFEGVPEELNPLDYLDATGVNSLQSTAMALLYLHTNLRFLKKQGYRAIHEDGSEFPLSAYFHESAV